MMYEKSIAFKAGEKAAQLGVPIEESGLRNLHPESDRYDQFVNGYYSKIEDQKDRTNNENTTSNT